MYTYYRESRNPKDSRVVFGADPANRREAADFRILTRAMNNHVMMCGNRRNYDRYLVVWEKAKADITPSEQPTHTFRAGRVELGDPSPNLYEKI